jgi:hypothetical protein
MSSSIEANLWIVNLAFVLNEIPREIREEKLDVLCWDLDALAFVDDLDLRWAWEPVVGVHLHEGCEPHKEDGD